MLLDARKSHRTVERIRTGQAPLTMDEAYAIQEAFVQACGLAPTGYKIGCASRESQLLVGASGPFAARVFAPFCFDSPAKLSVRDFFKLGVEAEFAFFIDRDLPARSHPYGYEEIASTVSEVAPMIELCDTRIADWKKASVEEIVADNGFHGGLVLGRRIADWQGRDLAHHEVVISIDGAIRGRGASADSLGDPLDSLVWVANHLSQRGHGLTQGEVVATGTWTGLHFVAAGAAVVADYGLLGRVEARITE